MTLFYDEVYQNVYLAVSIEDTSSEDGFNKFSYCFSVLLYRALRNITVVNILQIKTNRLRDRALDTFQHTRCNYHFPYKPSLIA